MDSYTIGRAKDYIAKVAELKEEIFNLGKEFEYILDRHVYVTDDQIDLTLLMELDDLFDGTWIGFEISRRITSYKRRN